jgi:hypothetical protein
MTYDGTTLKIFSTSGVARPLIIASGSSTNDLVRITQVGTGNAFVIEDAANPDSTPVIVDNSGNVGIGLTGPSTKLHVRSSTLNSNVVKVDGQSGELFTINDSLIGSLFSVNDISGLPIMEVFSDSTTVIGDYQAPSLYTTTRGSIVAGSTNQVIYQISASTYTSAHIDYNVMSGTNSRAGTITGIWSSNGLEFTETGTIDIGNLGTGAITLDLARSGTNIQLRASVSAGGGTWAIKSIIRAI